MAEGTCSVNGCGWTKNLRLGLCTAHYMRQRRTGSVRPDAPVVDRRRRRPFHDAEWCRARYEDDLMSFEEIAVLAECCLATVHVWLKRHGIRVQAPHIRAAVRGNVLRGELNPRWNGSSVCCCGNRKHRAATRCWECFSREEVGSGNPNWRGEEITYGAAHDRVRALLGPARRHGCTGCGKPANDWAYTHTDPAEKASPAGYAYSVDPQHYQPMCVPCHRRFDGRG